MAKKDETTVPIGPGAQLKLGPEDALRHLDVCAGNSTGTRKDHFILQASIALLREIVKEHKEWKPIVDKAKATAEAAATKPATVVPLKPNGKKAPRKRT